MSEVEWTDPIKEPKLESITVAKLVGDSFDDTFMAWDMTEVQKLVSTLQNQNVPDLAHAELLSQKALRCADILSEYLAKIVKIIHYLESKVSSAKNKAALEYKDPDGGRTTVEMKKWAGECSKDVEDVQIDLAKAKGTKAVLEKKYEIIIKTHHHYKEIAAGLRKTVLGYQNV